MEPQDEAPQYDALTQVAYVLPEDIDGRFDLVVDALFGFGSSGVPRPPFDQIIKRLGEIFAPVVSVDIPSGWDVERGDVHGLGFSPEVLVSLTAPKKRVTGWSYRRMPVLSDPS
jgi:hydroxyethylthiazole kinase-like uncharacterized protein yjeF